MRGEAMKKVLEELGRRGFTLGDKKALEFFAREGDWQTVIYASKVASLEAWEISPEFEANLKKNLPKATIRITDSFKESAKPEHKAKFGFLVLDNPQGSYGPNNMYTEHFQALECAARLLAPGGVLMFNINWAPFDFDKSPDWQKKRSAFYGIPDTSKLTFDFLFSFYEGYFKKLGLRTVFRFNMPRNNDYLSYMIFSLTPA